MSAERTLPPVHAWLPLLREGLARQGRFRWHLQGTSMKPTLPAGCEIEIIPPPERILLGALIVFADESSLVAHRLVHKTAHDWVAQGDARLTPDRRLAPGQVLGVVAAAYRDGAPVWPRRANWLLTWYWVGRAYLLAAFRRAGRLLGRLARLRAS